MCRAVVRCAWLLALLAAHAGAAEPAGLLRDFARGHVVIETRGQCLLLDVYLARGAAQRAQGLMHIRQLDEFEGMLFVTDAPAIVSMWMKNTWISLDMIFIGEDGRIAGIAERAPTLAEDLIRSPAAVTGVLEVNGGFAGRHGVAPGDRVLW